MEAGGTAGQKRTVAAMAALDKTDVGIGKDARAGIRIEADEGIVCGAKDERGNRDAVNDAGAGGAVVIVVGVAKAAIARDDLLVELADGANGADAVNLIHARKQLGLVADAAHEPAQKSPLVYAIGGFVQGVSTGSQIDDRADGGDGGERRLRAPLASELEHEIAAHGIADERDALEPETRAEVAKHSAHIGRAAGVIERGGERIAAPAIAHVHAHDIHAGGEGAHGDAPDIARIGRAFEAVYQHCGEARGAYRLGLPVAVTEDAAGIGGIDFDGFGDGGQTKLGPGEKVADNGLQVAVREPWMGFERREPGGRFRGLARRGAIRRHRGRHGG